MFIHVVKDCNDVFFLMTIILLDTSRVATTTTLF